MAQDTSTPYTQMDDPPPIQPGPQIQPQRQQDRNRYEKYPRKHVLNISVTVVVLGFLCVISGIVDLILNRQSVTFVGAGIWGGLLFVLVGTIGVMSAKNATSCWIVTALTMSIIGAVMSIGALIAGAIGWDYNSRQLRHNLSYEQRYPNQHDYFDHLPDIADQHLSVAMNALIVFIALIGGILLIITSTLSCYGLCSGKSSNKPMLVAGQVQYIPGPDGQQQMVIIPINQGASYAPGQQVVLGNPQALTLPTVIPTAPPSASSPEAPPAYEEKQQPPDYHE